MTPRIRSALAAALFAAFLAAAPVLDVLAPPTASAATQVAAGRGRLSVDVWINKEEGGVFHSGEKMQVYFRASQDSYVLLYNIDTEGYIHLIYPFRPGDPVHVQGGETYRVPSRHDPYDLVAEGPEGVEYVVALSSPVPFLDLPWYLAPGLADEPRDRGDTDPGDDLEDGVIVGDPFVGMERLHRRLVPRGREDQVATADTYFYIERRVEYPRYVCADCHHRNYWFDPYANVCNVIEIRIDATWARYAPLRVGSARPRYYYQVRPDAPTRYRAWKERWSSLDGNSNLRTRFVLEREARDQRLRDGSQRRNTPPEFKDLRRYRPGRFWKGRDEVIPLRERRERTIEKIRERQNEGSQSEERGRKDGVVRERRDRGSRDQGPPPDASQQERRREPEPKQKPEVREKETPKKNEGDSKVREERGRSEERDRTEDRGRSERRTEPPPKTKEREDRSGRGR